MLQLSAEFARTSAVCALRGRGLRPSALSGPFLCPLRVPTCSGAPAPERVRYGAARPRQSRLSRARPAAPAPQLCVAPRVRADALRGGQLPRSPLVPVSVRLRASFAALRLPLLSLPGPRVPSVGRWVPPACPLRGFGVGCRSGPGGIAACRPRSSGCAPGAYVLACLRPLRCPCRAFPCVGYLPRDPPPCRPRWGLQGARGCKQWLRPPLKRAPLWGASLCLRPRFLIVAQRATPSPFGQPCWGCPFALPISARGLDTLEHMCYTCTCEADPGRARRAPPLIISVSMGS